MRWLIKYGVVALVVVTVMSTTVVQPSDADALKGAVGGALIGAGIGAVAGGGKGAATGAAIGAIGGALLSKKK